MTAFFTLATLAIDSLVAVFVVSLLMHPTLQMQRPEVPPQTASVASAFGEIVAPLYEANDFVNLVDVLESVASSSATSSEEVVTQEVTEVEEEPKETKRSVSKPKTVAVTKVATPAALPVAIETQTNEDFAEEVRIEISKMTNAFREAKNLHRLAYDMKLELGANTYSQTLLSKHNLSHNAANCDLTCRFDTNNYKAWAWGENLATLSFSKRPSAPSVAETFMEQWQKSAGHRDNLLSEDFTYQGIGVSLDGNEIYVVVDFSKPTL